MGCGMCALQLINAKRERQRDRETARACVPEEKLVRVEQRHEETRAYN